MTVKCDWNWQGSGHQVFYDGATFETLRSSHPVWFKDDFVGSAGGDIFDGTVTWKVTDVGAATEAIVNDSSGGLFALTLTTANEAQDTILDHGDNRNFDAGNNLIFETRVNLAVSAGTGVVQVWGVNNDHNLDKDASAAHAWFRCDASLAVKVETDDTTNNNDDVATGTTAVAGTFYIFRIDMQDLTDVKFYIDGVRVATTTTFDMSNLSAAEQQMQPYFAQDKATGTGVGTMQIDYVTLMSDRT